MTKSREREELLRAVSPLPPAKGISEESSLGCHAEHNAGQTVSVRSPSDISYCNQHTLTQPKP